MKWTAIIFFQVFFAASAFAGDPMLRQTFQRGAEVRSVIFSTTSTARLSTLINVDDYADYAKECDDAVCKLLDRNVAAPHQLCIVGDLHQVCALLIHMYERDKAEYEEGDHEITKLLSCHVLNAEKQVYIHIQAVQDFEKTEVIAEHKLAACH